MAADNSCATLSAISLQRGQLRGLGPFRLDFSYPISAIAGENGSGKSTLLAISACAFHNLPDGYKLGDRKSPYYTFSDFFVQATDELPPEGIRIIYEIRHNKWRRSAPGPGCQSRSKRRGGRWSNYDGRVKRNVVYFGIQRVVPHYERSAHKSYRGRFKIGGLDEEIRHRICQIAGRIIDKRYDQFEQHNHSKYTLPIATCDGVRYSGFNMGAGESALFEILTAIFEAGRGAFLVIDEIEIGLHEKAQRRLIKELKLLCQERHCQILCSTHSPVILDALPPQGRFFIEAGAGNTVVLSGISADYACGKLGGRNAGEIDIFVEDDVAEKILRVVLPLSLRERVRISPIGSAGAVLRQLAGRYLEGIDNCIAILDGDKQADHNQNRRCIREYAETRFRQSEDEMNRWIDARLDYLPGDS